MADQTKVQIGADPQHLTTEVARLRKQLEAAQDELTAMARKLLDISEFHVKHPGASLLSELGQVSESLDVAAAAIRINP